MLEVIEPYLGEIILACAFISTKYLEKGTLREALQEFVGFAWDKEKMKDSAVLSALTVEANKNHGKEVNLEDQPEPRARTVAQQNKQLLEGIAEGIGNLSTEFLQFKDETTHHFDSIDQRLTSIEKWKDSLNLPTNYIKDTDNNNKEN